MYQLSNELITIFKANLKVTYSISSILGKFGWRAEKWNSNTWSPNSQWKCVSMLRLFAHQLGIGVCPKYQVLLIIHLLYKHHDGWVIWYVAIKDFRFLDSGPNMKYPLSTFGPIWFHKWFMKRSALLGWYFFSDKKCIWKSGLFEFRSS